ncbi:Hypothetical protein A7982_00068 [Minicystis rosea]|nr:Hypothetical protein A7982_00068 [Minicystis rosea]
MNQRIEELAHVDIEDSPARILSYGVSGRDPWVYIYGW